MATVGFSDTHCHTGTHEAEKPQRNLFEQGHKPQLLGMV
jgi:hypothetical protein